MWKCEISKKDNMEGENIKKAILDIGIKIERCEVIQVYYLFGEIREQDISIIAEELLTDKVCETYKIVRRQRTEDRKQKEKECHIVEVAYNPGVMDPVSASALKGILDLGIDGVSEVRTAKKYFIQGNLTNQEIDFICNKLLVNSTIQHIVQKSEVRSQKSEVRSQKSIEPIHINILSANIDKLLLLSKEHGLALNGNELKKIQEYYKNLNREPTDIELETIAQTWSEHCGHKTFRSEIEFNGKIIPPLLTLLMQTTNKIKSDFPVSVFKDNAGIVKFNDK
ncbi:MAG: phosphoribosylformylglycinamidine synthase subunit PurS [Candidatus Stahlbacteria bacterium]|nr:phosphoribosylformylglycinamidine synthase subunit PurS [Candidatus Stahlbacteria bacterium]